MGGVYGLRRIAVGVLAACAACSDAPVHSGSGTETEGPTEQGTSAATASEPDETGASSSEGTEPEPEVEVDPAPGGLRRLTALQYTQSIEVLLGPEAAAAADPPDDQAILGFDAIGARQESLSPVAIERYERSALAVARAAVANPETLIETVPCVGEGGGGGCYQRVAADFGRLAWRRGLKQAEFESIVDIAQQARAWGDDSFDVGLEYELAVLLQSPDFLYAVELGEPDEDGDLRLTRNELATRLALFIQGQAPDAALFARAKAGELDDADGIREVAATLLQHPAANASVRAHFDELLRVRDLPQRSKDPELFPNFSSELAASMREETLRFVSEVVFFEADYRALFDADYTFIDDRLAAFYGVESPGHVFAKRPLPNGQKRRGILTQPALLAVMAHPDRNSPTRRGQFLQQSMLCNEVPPPPGDQDTTLPEPAEPTTLRARLEQHLEAGATCAACHTQTDPPGFAFEHFDASGAYRTQDNGYPVDASGSIEGFGSWEDARDLALLVRDDERMPACATQNLYRFAIGHPNGDGQQAALAAVKDAFVAADYDYRELMIELAASPAFTRVGEAQ